MKIAIMGMGGVGGYYGGKLAAHYAGVPEHAIYFIARGRHLREIRKRGLTVVTPDSLIKAVPAGATDTPAELGPMDLILLCVKTYHLEDAARSLTDSIHANTVVIPLSNGVDNAETLRRILRKGILLNGCVYISSHIAKPGIVEQTGGSCRLVFGPENGASQAYRDIETLLQNAGIKAELSGTIALEAWTKFIFIGPLASITALFDETVGAVMGHPDHRLILEGLMKEVELVARAGKIPLPPDIVAASMAMASRFPSDTKTSMQVDVEKGNRTEIDTFTGYVIHRGKEAGIDTPFHDMVYAALQKIII